jgi:hypothetical protein
MKQQVRERKATPLRLEDGLRLQLESIAKDNGISFSATSEALITYALQQLGANVRITTVPTIILEAKS